MNNQHQKTNRLILRPLQTDDSRFIQELVNTKGWLTFIGERNVRNNTDAINYIEKIISNDKVTYWVVELLDNTKIGVITLIKREHLPFHDIGFAFSPTYQGSGYAYEASKAILEYVINTTDYQTILAATNPRNTSSIKLIEKLGLTYYKTEIQNDQESNLYKLDLEKLKIDRLVKKFFSSFTNKNSKPQLHILHQTCLDQVTIVKNTNGQCETYDLQNFITPREELLTNGMLQDFEEYELEEKTTITRHIAQRVSHYQKNGNLNGRKFSEKGSKMFQLVKTNTEWKITNVIWDDEPLTIS